MAKPLVSVLITTYNHEAWIEACLESVLNQRDVNIEVLVHDDNSNDATCEILEKYADRCTIVKNDTGINIGVSKSFNKIRRLATGDYIAMVSGDDAWHLDKLSRQLAFMEANKSFDICFTDSITMDAAGNHGARYPAFLPDNLNRKQWIYRLAFSNCILAASSFIRNNAWAKNNEMNESMRQLQDWDFWIRAVCSGLNFHTLQEPLAYYRIVVNSVSHEVSPQRNSRNHFETIQCLKSFELLHLTEVREVFGTHLEDHPMFIKDRSVQTGLAIVLRLINQPAHRHAAADLLHARFAGGTSNISDHEYQDFIGSLHL